MTETNNITNHSFTKDFCSFLEYRLEKTFANSNQKTIQALWCDGINHEPLNKSKKAINDTRQLITTAWIGFNGQDKYEMTLHFGSKALGKYAKGLDLTDCIPLEEHMDWITIDTDKKTIQLRLL